MSLRDSSQNAISILQRHNKIYARLLEISLLINTNLAIEPTLKLIMEAVCEITNAEAASILLYNPNSNELRFVATNTPELARIPVPLEGSIAGQIARENKPIVINEAQHDPRIYRSVDESIGFKTRSLMGVPMHVKGTVIGVLEALNRREGPWTDDNLAHLIILASHAAVALQNAHQAEALRKANEELKKIDKIKNDFIAIASHELRTPLSVILGYASFLKDEVEGEMSEHATAVLNSAMSMRTLIEDLTNLRFLERGQIELAREEIPVALLVNMMLADLQALAKAKGHRLRVDPANSEAVVSVDRLKVATALINILNNAIKFTPNNGQIDIAVERRGREIWIKISDNGIGIPSDQLEKIFDEFYQVADHMTRRQNGMGIGLSIARGMVQAHNGRVWAESKGMNRGSTFYVALPGR